ncbi:peptidoglycan-binding protein [Dyella sp.]|uniref:peptidoglycan-binding protein n=1 Tax=Dyella sp. TaxID=1869338 RepID=UPI002ED54AE0
MLDLIGNEAQRHGIPQEDFLRFAAIETGNTFNPNAQHSAHGAKGLFQFEPDTAAHYGIAGRELDAAANADAAARFYQDNRAQLVRQHNTSGEAYLSGNANPNGMDMYLAHQQGAAGYKSIQDAITEGHFSKDSTRHNIMNNLGADAQRLTGHTRAELSNMSDRDLAQNFVSYWHQKYDNISIPEKGIHAANEQQPAHAATQPAHAAPTQTPPAHAAPAATQPETPAAHAPKAGGNDGGVVIATAYDQTVHYTGKVAYGLGQKNPDAGKVDCSGWVVKMENATMDEINAKSGTHTFSAKDHFSSAYDAAATIVEKTAERSGSLLEGKQVNAAALKEGMIIGEDNGPTSFDKGRYKGIDHITMVVRDPKTNELMISQSSGGKGVHLEPVQDYLDRKEAHGTKLFATDPLAKARNLMHDSHPTVPPATHKAGAAHPDATHASHPGTLREGDHGKQVQDMQERLSKLGYHDASGKALQPDRDFGPKTKEAVEAFQRDHKLKPDGIVGPDTVKAIDAATHQQQQQHSNNAQAQAASAADRMIAAMQTGNQQAVAHAANQAAQTQTGQQFQASVSAQADAQQQQQQQQAQQQQQQQQAQAPQRAAR